MMSDQYGYQNPDHETKCRLQNEKETLGGSCGDVPSPWKVGNQLNDFVLEELLGSGSSGYVFRALDVRTQRRCALKLLKPSSPDDLLRNKLGFRRMMSIEHPNLLRVDRIYQLGEYIALSMDEIEGMTFGKAIVEIAKQPANQAHAKLLQLLRDFASGLAMMHANGYVHRDIKPENLMVNLHGRGRVIDYGLVDAYELSQASFSSRGFLLGTPHYFAAEVLWSQQYLPAGDIFSLGIVMVEALRCIQKGSGTKKSDIRRSATSQLDDAEGIDQAIEDLSISVPRVIRESCREMLNRHPGDRPTAMGLSRLGLTKTHQIEWPLEQPLIGRSQVTGEIFEWINRIFDGDIGRLHLTGPSGIGKSRLVQEIIAYVESKKWGQLFSARCGLREDQSLQAFDQICDAITHRYMKGDRERLELDTVSVEILQGVFPVLKNVLTRSLTLMPSNADSERLDALEAAARLSEQLRLVGPLFLVIDDAQWADRDSLNVLDRLQSAVGSLGLGIVTVSREREDPQRVPASKYIALQPLTLEDSKEILHRSARRWDVELPEAVVEELAGSAHGSPFRLRELSDEFRPGGALSKNSGVDQSISALTQVDRLWQRRAERLSDDAKRVLPLVVTAGGRVSTRQLGELSGLGDAVDAAISELAHQRLITDEATGGECIAIFHDRVADEMISKLSDEMKSRSHHDWAAMLVRQDNPERLAARIAGHFFAAGEPGRAVAHAILAAEDAERRVATSEAARWYARVVEHVQGAEKIRQIRNAARCYDQSDLPVQAAECYQWLAELVDGDERMECRLKATVHLIRSGRFSEVHGQLQDLTQTLRLPKPKPPWRHWIGLMAGQLKLSLLGKQTLPPWDGGSAESAKPDAHQSMRTRFCLALIRPISMFDSLYAAELSAAGTCMAMKQGDACQRVHVMVGKSVFDCYDRGHRRVEGNATLLGLKSTVETLQDATASGDLWSGIAYSHALACRWDQVSQPVERSVEAYRAANTSHGFELAHTQWLDVWANWHLGRWQAMSRLSDEMFNDAMRRNNLFQQLVVAGGFGSAVWLGRDQAEQWKRICASNTYLEPPSDQAQTYHLFFHVASMLCRLYEGKSLEAWKVHQQMVPHLGKMPFKKMQLIRITACSLGGLAALHNLVEQGSSIWDDRLNALTQQLKQEQNGFARVVAHLYEGLSNLHTGIRQQDKSALELARERLLDARDEARASRLRPYQLAAEDALTEIHTGKSLHLLADRMRKQNVVRPECFQRLYTVSTAAVDSLPPQVSRPEVPPCRR